VISIESSHSSVMASLGNSFKRHVKDSFDVFVHLKNELPLSADGHRPVNDQLVWPQRSIRWLTSAPSGSVCCNSRESSGSSGTTLLTDSADHYKKWPARRASILEYPCVYR
jgi:hypothetical protein